MKTEIEAKFLAVDHPAIREKLRAAGATCEYPMRLMRRVTFDGGIMKQKGGWVRVRDEGERVTMTYKQINTFSIDGVHEAEIIVNDFETAVAILQEVGLEDGSFQESKRETWNLDGAEIVLDEWPWLKPYIEIEAESEATVRATAVTLELDWSKAKFGDVMVAYRAQYPHLSDSDTIGNLAQVRFTDPLPALLKP